MPMTESAQPPETALEAIESISLPTQAYGELTLKVFQQAHDPHDHIALIKGQLDDQQVPVLVRLHSECLTGDVFDSARCDCGWQLQTALTRIAQQGGVLLYLRQEGRGIGLLNKLKAYHLQDQGLDTVEANHQLGFSSDARDYRIAAYILKALHIQRIRLLTNNPKKIADLQQQGIQVVERLPLVANPNRCNQHYLKTKQLKLGHLLNLG